MADPTWISTLPPLLAIVLAIATRQVYLSLAAGIALGWVILADWNLFAGAGDALDNTVAVLADDGNAKVILFTLVIGALIATVETFGGVKGFVRWLESNEWVTNGRRALLLAWITGVIIFVESNITVLVAGAVTRPLVDRYKVSREKLAYIIDSTSAPICILIPLNAWGAYNLGILGEVGVSEPLGVFLRSLPLNFYPIAAVILAFATAVWGLDFGPMKRAEARTRGGEILWPEAQPMIDESVTSPEGRPGVVPKAMNMILPIVTMILVMPLGLWVTGDGNMADGSGSTSVLWAVLAALLVAWILLIWQRQAKIDDLNRTAVKGAGGLMPLALILLLALALGDVAAELGTGVYVAQVTAEILPPPIFLPLVFLVSSGIAFSTGTSWGTFAIMLPIAVPAGEALGLPLAPFVAAAISGGIFGDHCSPISDTTIISSMASATDHIDHVRTQLPYALLAGGAATLAFGVLGMTL